jgi:hypothetical protein
MNHALKIAVVGVLLIVVIFVVVHPLVDLEPTVFRSFTTSFLGLAVLFLVLTVASSLTASCCQYPVGDNSSPCRKDHLSRLDLTCTSLC